MEFVFENGLYSLPSDMGNIQGYKKEIVIAGSNVSQTAIVDVDLSTAGRWRSLDQVWPLW